MRREGEKEGQRGRGGQNKPKSDTVKATAKADNPSTILGL